jgi:hypothetical protein
MCGWRCSRSSRGIDITYRDYKKFRTDTRVVGIGGVHRIESSDSALAVLPPRYLPTLSWSRSFPVTGSEHSFGLADDLMECYASI